MSVSKRSEDDRREDPLSATEEVEIPRLKQNHRTLSELEEEGVVSWDGDSNVVGEAPHFADTLGEMFRFVLSYFGDASAELASGDAVATARRDNDGEPRASIRLHYIERPKLAAVGLVDYDARTKTVRYHDHSRLEHIQERLVEFNSGITWGRE